MVSELLSLAVSHFPASQMGKIDFPALQRDSRTLCWQWGEGPSGTRSCGWDQLASRAAGSPEPTYPSLAKGQPLASQWKASLYGHESVPFASRVEVVTGTESGCLAGGTASRAQPGWPAGPECVAHAKLAGSFNSDETIASHTHFLFRTARNWSMYKDISAKY